MNTISHFSFKLNNATAINKKYRFGDDLQGADYSFSGTDKEREQERKNAREKKKEEEKERKERRIIN